MTRWIVLLALMIPSAARAQIWSGPVRGSWVVDGKAAEGDVDLSACEIVVGQGEGPPVKQAATFLAADLERLTGRKPQILFEPSLKRPAIVLITGSRAQVDEGIRGKQLADQWEAFQILTRPKSDGVWLVGS